MTRTPPGRWPRCASCIAELDFKGPHIIPWLWEAPPTDRPHYPPYAACVEIVGGHIGYPWTEEMIAVCRKHENVYIDTSAYTSKRLPPELVAYMKTGGGRHKVMFGSNDPMIPSPKALEDIAALELDEEARQLYLEGNARRVFDCG
jgi:uncharacterized protein